MLKFVILAAALLAADQWVKLWTVQHLALGESAPLLPGFTELTRVHNYGAAWSSFSGMRWVLVTVTAVIVAVVIVLLAKRVIRHPLGLCAGWLVIAGGIGNLIDRVRLGYVVDMFHFEFWPSYPVFNVADMGIVFGMILGVIYYIFLYEKCDKRG